MLEILRVGGVGGMIGNIPAPISSSAVEPEGASGYVFSAFLQAESTLQMLLQQHSHEAASAGLP